MAVSDFPYTVQACTQIRAHYTEEICVPAQFIDGARDQVSISAYKLLRKMSAREVLLFCVSGLLIVLSMISKA